MKKFKSAAMGFVAGAMCMVSVTAFGAYSEVTTQLFNDVTFTFDGEKKASPSDQPVLNYNGYTYVPLRYVAETLGAKVNWDIAKRDIDIQSDKKTYIKEVEVEKIVYVEKGELDGDKAVYSKLPIKSRKNDHVLEVTGVSRDTVSHYTKIFVNLENKNSQGVQLIPSSAKLTVDDKEVARFPIIHMWDSSWETSYVETDETREGYVIFDLVDENYEKMHLTFDVRNLDGKIETYSFYFKK